MRENVVNVSLKETISMLPDSPGCYQYFDENGELIYVGKAKNLKKRVSSYFNKTLEDPKTRVLVRKIREIRYIIVESEADALLLENNMIKEHQPRYNIMLKDDKTYPWLVLKNEPFPRIFSTRTVVNDKSLYFGPYPSVPAMKVVLKLISDLYMIRTCRFPLTKENICAHKFKVCLQYHIKKCQGPCEGLQPEEDYNRNIQAAKEILSGNLNPISQQLLNRMKSLSEELKFEEAQILKEKYDILENYKSRFIVVSPNLSNIDVFSFDENDHSAYINYLHIRSGLVVQGYTIEYKKRLNEAKEDLLALGIVEMRTRFKSKSKEIIVPFLPDMEMNDVHMIIPQRGDKKKLLDLSEKNVRQYKLEQLKHAEKLNPEQRSVRILMTLQKDLHLPELPVQIECFDNSNIQGTNPVSACVVFKKGKPSKKDYRHFNIKTVIGPDDYSSMYETVFRRYKRQSEEGQPLPQLIVIDGGKGQLHSAINALNDLGLYGKIAIIGIAERLEEIYFPNDPIPLYLDKNSESLKVIQHLRDEAHRFGITFHRLKRSKQQLVSELDSIKGIGDVIKTKLLSKYKSVKRIKEAAYPEIVELIGKSKADTLFKGLNPEEKI